MTYSEPAAEGNAAEEHPAEQHTAEEWAGMLAHGWEQRARHPSRDLFVASNPGWRDPVVWERYARQDLTLFLVDLDRAALMGTDVLEIGCGSGRLVPFLRPQVTSYTGFDIAPGMVEAARARCASQAGVRFFVGNGLGVPAGARDRRYGLVIAVAVFIHCPRSVIAANLASAWGSVAPGGQLRFQVLADPTDPSGMTVHAGTTALVDEVQQVLGEVTAAEMAMASESHYLGHRFRFVEIQELAERITCGRVELYRGDLGAIYGAIHKANR